MSSVLPPPEALIAEYRLMATTGTQFRGNSIRRHSRTIHKLIARFGAQTLLDYGCGRGDAYDGPDPLHRQWSVAKPTLYDPAFPQHDELPMAGELFDGVLCSDVLEHVHPDDVARVIDDLFRRARRFVWASVCTREAKKRFSNGINMHVCVEPIEWWAERFAEAAGRHVGVEWCLQETR